MNKLGQSGDASGQPRIERELTTVVFLVRNSVIHPCQPAAPFAIEPGDQLQHVKFTCAPNLLFTFGVCTLK